jgi:hypothetical protein
MLIELNSMYKGLKEVGEAPVIKHNDIQAPGMGTTFRVWLKPNGDVTGIQLLDREKIQNTWSLGNGNKNQFPATKLSYPLLPEAHGLYMAWKKSNPRPDAKAYRQVISELANENTVEHSGQKTWPIYRAKIKERQSQLEYLREGEGACVYELFSRYLKSETGLTILEQVAAHLVLRAESGIDKYELKKICDALFADSVDSKGKMTDSVKVTLLLDFRPKDDLNIGVTSREWVPYISDALFSNEANQKLIVGNCALSGEQCELVLGKFPSEKISIVGSTILLSKNAGTSGPTVERYKRSGSESYPSSEKLCQKLAATLSKITSAELKGKTWIKVASANGKPPSLLLAYCMDDLGLGLATLFSGEDNDIEDFEDYTKATERVLRLIRGGKHTFDAIVAIAEIAVLDKANRKINHAHFTTVKQIHEAALQWRDANRNAPHFYYQVQIGHEKKFVESWSLAPQRVVEVTRYKYIRDGSESTTVPAISIADTMRLFLSSSERVKPFAHLCLSRVVSQYKALCQYVVLANLQSRLGQKALIKTNIKLNSNALDSLSLLSVLLYKSGRFKEVYMSECAFQLGQLCSAMDELHIGYCKSVRDGQIPSTLLGNQTYGIALNNPFKAMGVLATRLKPYEAWAKKQPGQNKDKAVVNGIFAYRWLKQHAGELNLQLAKVQRAPDDQFKAELMLGYLAGRPFENKAKRSDKSQIEGEE